MSQTVRTARLVSARALSEEIKHFVFEVPETESLAYEPGQFVSFTDDFDGKPVTRAYSIASAPNGNRFELCLNLVADGRFSPKLFGMTPGEALAMQGPLGTFTLRRPVRETIMVATGTGIAPFRGMLSMLAEAPPESGHGVTLIFGARHEGGLVFRDEFEQLAGSAPWFRFIPTLTRPPEHWNGHTGRVQPILIETLGERRDLDIYACGLAAMTGDVRALLKDRGFERRQIIIEKYD
jgi:CDP-4-dehydro-6-deoxyglucose reductase